MEARELSIEVSVLSPLFEISSRKILPRHGIVIENDTARGVFAESRGRNGLGPRSAVGPVESGPADQRLATARNAVLDVYRGSFWRRFQSQSDSNPA